jgi:hypothetical protein
LTRVLHRPSREEKHLLAPSTTSSPQQPAPVVPPLPGIAADVLFDLRTEDAIYSELTAARALLLLPLHRPVSGLAALLREAEHVIASRDLACRALFAEDRQRREASAAAAWFDETVGWLLAENSTAVADVLTARPELLHDTALLMALAPIVTQLGGAL